MVRLSPRVPEWLRAGITYGFLAWMIFVGSWVYDLNQFAHRLTLAQQNRILEEQIYRHISDAESAQRGYLLTGERTYLDDYYANIQEMHAAHRTLIVFLRSRPDESKTLSDLGSAISDKLSEMNATIDAYQHHGFTASVAIMKSGQGLVDMHKIEDLLNILIAEERDRARKSASMIF